MANNNQIYKMSNAGGFKSLTRYYDMLAGNTTWNPWSPQGAFDALATVTVPSGGAASVTFAGIPTGYKHLQIRAIARSTASNSNNASIKINGDTGSNYAQHQLYGDGSSVGAGGGANQSASGVATFHFPNSSQLANTFGAGIMDILDYSSTTKYKVTRLLTGVDLNGSTSYLIMRSALWMNTAAVTDITFTPDSSASFAQYSQFALYGVK